MKFRKACGTSIASIAVISALAGCSGGSGGSGGSGTPGAAAGPLEKTNLVVDAFPAIDSAGLFIAEQEGLFKAQGLNVKIDLATDSQAAITGQLAGTYDITSADYVTYVDNVLLDKAPLRIVAESSFLQPNVLTLLVKGGSRVTSVGERKNRTVSVNAPKRHRHPAHRLRADRARRRAELSALQQRRTVPRGRDGSRQGAD
jgi:NitT/TauT family transport system substrate-binding protein